ncbi:MAG: thioesterase family protein [Mogibacterium sp.]|nr:thioesterase family protein [Mogibacterium sp.]
MSELITGIKGYSEEIVTEDRTASGMTSGGLPVYATPRMVSMMEYTAWSSVEPYMEEGKGTVGIHLDISHLAASPLGAHIYIDSELIEIDRRRLVFRVTARDDEELIGEGKHERFIIDNEKFMAKTLAKAGK